MQPKVEMPVQKIARYELIEELGRGAMGVVYKATDPNIGRTVALKTMRMDVHGIDQQEMLQRFRQEARAAGVLNDPNIVTVYDAGEHDGLFYIALEYIEGMTLAAKLQEQRVVAPAEIIAYSRHVCTGLDYAHQKGIIHRDVKPANIMISPDGLVKIMDFGIAKFGGGMTSAGQVLGTPNYMSPEQVRGRDLDGRSDLFSYGVILYEMLTGEKPFTGQNVTTIIYKIVNEQPIAPRELDVTIHPGLSAIITKALAKNPDERYQTGAEMVHDLENFKSFGSAAETTSKFQFESAATMKLDTAAVAAASAAPARQGVPPPPSQKIAPAAPPSQKIAQPANAPGATSQRIGSSGRISSASGKTMAPAPAPPAALPPKPLQSTMRVAPKPTAVAKPKQVKPRREISPKVLVAVAGVLVIGGGSFFAYESRHQTAVQQQTAQVQAQAQATAPVEGAPPERSKSGRHGKSKGLVAPDTVTKNGPTSSAPAAAATTGALRVTSTPEGAHVQISGPKFASGSTPFDAADLPPGNYDAAVTKSGFANETRHLHVDTGKTATVGVVLKSTAVAQAIISATSDPAGANIIIDGQPTGKKTPADISVTPGDHQVLLVKQGFREANTSTAQLKPGEKFNFAPILEKAKGEGGIFRRMFGEGIPQGKGVVTIRTFPEGAQVFVNGKAAQKLTPLRWPANPGRHNITVKLNGYQPENREFDVTEGKVTPVEIVLKPQR